MLQHVLEVQELDLVFSGVDLLIAVLEVRFNDKCGGPCLLALAWSEHA